MIRPAGNTWIRSFGPASAALRLVCFPHAGGGANFFRDWPQRLADVQILAVQAPGREDRFGEPAFTRLQPLLGSLISALRPVLQPPFAFFGHSLGALVAFETARLLRELRQTLPTHLILSARRGPMRPGLVPPLSTLTDAELKAHLGKLQGTPTQVLHNDELLNILLPTLPADFTVNDTHEYQPAEPLTCPITVFGGSLDSQASLEDLEAWRPQTAAAFTLRQFAGDHFYLKDNAEFFAALAVLLRTESPA